MNKEDRARIEELKRLISINDPLPWERGEMMSTNRWDLTILAMNSLPELIEIIEKQTEDINWIKGVLQICQSNQIEILYSALESISKNGCCDGCQEAKLVAIAALKKVGIR